MRFAIWRGQVGTIRNGAGPATQPLNDQGWENARIGSLRDLWRFAVCNGFVRMASGRIASDGPTQR
jgi:hypothetical protein